MISWICNIYIYRDGSYGPRSGLLHHDCCIKVLRVQKGGVSKSTPDDPSMAPKQLGWLPQKTSLERIHFFYQKQLSKLSMFRALEFWDIQITPPKPWFEENPGAYQRGLPFTPKWKAFPNINCWWFGSFWYVPFRYVRTFLDWCLPNGKDRIPTIHFQV